MAPKPGLETIAEETPEDLAAAEQEGLPAVAKPTAVLPAIQRKEGRVPDDKTMSTYIVHNSRELKRKGHADITEVVTNPGERPQGMIVSKDYDAEKGSLGFRISYDATEINKDSAEYGYWKPADNGVMAFTPVAAAEVKDAEVKVAGVLFGHNMFESIKAAADSPPAKDYSFDNATQRIVLKDNQFLNQRGEIVDAEQKVILGPKDPEHKARLVNITNAAGETTVIVSEEQANDARFKESLEYAASHPEVLDEAYKSVVKGSDKRKEQATSVMDALTALENAQYKSSHIDQLQTLLGHGSEAVIAADTSFGAFCKAASSGFKLLRGSDRTEDIAKCTKFAKDLGEKFSFLKDDFDSQNFDKGQDATKLDGAFKALRESDSVKSNPALAAEIQQQHDGHTKALQEGVATAITAAMAKEKSAAPAPAAPNAAGSASKGDKDEVDASTKAKIAAATTSVKMLAIGGVGIAVTIVFPPFAAILVLGGAAFAAYKIFGAKKDEPAKEEPKEEQEPYVTAAEFMDQKRMEQGAKGRGALNGTIPGQASAAANAAAAAEIEGDLSATEELLVGPNGAQANLAAAADVAQNGVGATLATAPKGAASPALAPGAVVPIVATDPAVAPEALLQGAGGPAVTPVAMAVISANTTTTLGLGTVAETDLDLDAGIVASPAAITTLPSTATAPAPAESVAIATAPAAAAAAAPTTSAPLPLTEERAVAAAVAAQPNIGKTDAIGRASGSKIKAIVNAGPVASRNSITMTNS